MLNVHKVAIREAYENYAPPVNAAMIVAELLETVPDKYLLGLHTILLTNETALSRRDRIGRVWSRKRKFDKSRILGRYYGRTRGRPAYIELRVDKILRWCNTLPAAFLFRKLLFGNVLFHEIGHHIHRTQRPEYKEKEDVADKWSVKLNVNFVRKRYWWALPFLVPVAKVITFFRRKRRGQRN